MARKKVVDRTKKGTRTVVREMKMMKCADLKPYYKNPRIGNVNKVAMSLHLNGQFRPIVVNIGTHTGRKNEILAGNHTWLGARKEIEWDSGDLHYKKESWEDIQCVLVDVDENRARAINLADNKTGDDSKYEEGILAELLAMVPKEESAATGFDLDEIDSIVAANKEIIENAVAVATEQLHEEEERVAEAQKKKTFDGVPLGEEDNAEDEEEYEERIEHQSEELEGMLTFKSPELVIFEGTGPFGIPKLLPDQLMTFDELPDNLSAWAGSATRDDDDPDRWWLYNWAIDSTSGMKDISKVIVSFYTFDKYFENWWYTPDKYMAKLYNSGIKYLITPNFSQATELPKVESLYALYKSRWIGRYAQECGMKIIPDIAWRDGDIDWLKKQTLSTLPKGLPMISMQLQTIDPKTVEGGMAHFVAQLQAVFDVLEPQGALLYTGPQGKEIIETQVDTHEIPLRFLETRQSKLSEVASKREKKTTI